jgi:hypothetical protein
MRTVLDDARRMLRENPAMVTAVLLMVALAAGLRAAVFYEADGEELRLIADGGSSMQEASDESQSSDLMDKMRARMGCPEKIPGFTVIVGLSHYNVELSVPVRGIDRIFESTRPEVARSLSMRLVQQAA